MPNHWRPIDPHNPNPKERDKEVRDAVERYGGKERFIGCKQGSRDWWLLADVTHVKAADMPHLEKDVRVKANTKPEIWLSPSELPPAG